MKPAVRRLHHELPLLATYGLQYKKLSIVVSDSNHDANGKKKNLCMDGKKNIHYC